MADTKAKTGAWTEAWTTAILRYRWVVMALAAALVVAAGAGGQRIVTADDFRILIGEDNPQLKALDRLEDTYSAASAAVVAIAPKSGETIFTRETLQAIEELTEAAWQTPYSSRVDSITNYNHSAAEGDDLIVQPLVEDAASLTNADIRRIRDIALNSRELAGRLVSSRGHATAMVITFAKPEAHGDMVKKTPDYLNAMLDEARAKYPRLGFYLTGDVLLNRTIADAIDDGSRRLIPTAFLIMLVCAVLLLRSFVGMLAIVVVMLCAVATTMGSAGWAGVVLSPMNSGVPIIIMVLTVAHSVHIITTTIIHMREGLQKNAAIRQSFNINTYPVFLASLTTIIGFASLNTSDSPPIQSLGNLAALGMLCVFVFCMTLLPALLSVLPLRPPKARSGQVWFFEWLGGFVTRRYKALLVCGLVAFVAIGAGIPKNRLSDDWTKQFDESYQFRVDTDFVIDNITGLNSLEYSLNAGREGGVTELDYLRKVAAFAEWAAAQPEVLHVRSFVDIMKRLNRVLNGDDPAFYRLPDNAELAAQYLLLYELSIPFGGDLNDRIDIGKSSTRMTLTARDVPANDLRRLDARAQAWLQANAPGLAGEASGITMIFAHMAQRNIESMLLGTIIGMGLISFLLILVFKSLKMGLVSLAPNFIPPALGFGLWGYMVGQISLAASITTIIAFGIIVDDTIHFMSKYLKARNDGEAAPQAVRYAFRMVGPALLTTTIVLCAGFTVFGLSGYEGIWVVGQMVTLIIALGLIIDFLFLPPLLMLISRSKS